MAENKNITDVTREYYDSSDADNFYYNVWGGEDIHIGLYLGNDNAISDASQRTVAFMTGMLKTIGPSSHVLDLGAGYGGSARFMVKRYGCTAEALNLSLAQNQRDREINKAQGLDDKINVTDGDFENVPYDNGTFDIVWSQDSFLHSGNRRKVMEEAYRVLKPGGELIFTDPMQVDNVSPENLKPIYDRIHLESMASFSFYQKVAGELGLKTLNIVDLTHQLGNHYDNVRKELKGRNDEIRQYVSQEYIDRMITGLGHWVDGCRNGYLAWGILHFQK